MSPNGRYTRERLQHADRALLVKDLESLEA